MPRNYDATQYPWLLTADPPVCRSGPALGILRRCERIRMGAACQCRFPAGDLAELLDGVGAPELAEYFATALEPEDVEELADRIDRMTLATTDEEAILAVAQLRQDIRRLVRHGSGLTDRYSDDLD